MLDWIYCQQMTISSNVTSHIPTTTKSLIQFLISINFELGWFIPMPPNDTFPIEIDYCWFIRIITQSACTTLSNDNFLEFLVEMRSKLSINFVGLSHTEKKRSSSENPTKFIQNDNKTNELASQPNNFVIRTHTRTNTRKWCWTTIEEMKPLIFWLACAFSMSLINTV